MNKITEVNILWKFVLCYQCRSVTKSAVAQRDGYKVLLLMNGVFRLVPES